MFSVNFDLLNLFSLYCILPARVMMMIKADLLIMTFQSKVFEQPRLWSKVKFIIIIFKGPNQMMSCSFFSLM